MSDEELITFVVSPNKHALKLSGTKGIPLSECDRFSVSGGPFESTEEAQTCADSVRIALMLMATRNRKGIDLGQNALRSFGMTEYGKKYLASLFKADCVQEDHLGITVFAMEPMPKFLHMSAKGIVSRPAQKFVEELADVTGQYRFASPKSEIAAGLYAFSHFVAQAPARFLMLFLSLEALFDPLPRSNEAQAHVQTLIEATLQASNR